MPYSPFTTQIVYRCEFGQFHQFVTSSYSVSPPPGIDLQSKLFIYSRWFYLLARLAEKLSPDYCRYTSKGWLTQELKSCGGCDIDFLLLSFILGGLQPQQTFMGIRFIFKGFSPVQYLINDPSTRKKVRVSE